MDNGDRQKRKWQKILYEKQDFPDNYVDVSFLNQLRKNVYSRKYEYWHVVQESGVVTQHISSICVFLVVYIYMSEMKLDPLSLFAISSVLTLMGYLIDHIIKGGRVHRHSRRSRFRDLKTAVIFLGFSFILSPVLVSLTESISTDTVYAMTTMMLLANLLSHDYGANAAIVSGSLSFNAGTFASVCLASRLHSASHAFVLVTFALEVFSLWPALRQKIKTKKGGQITLTVGLTIVAFTLLSTVSVFGAVTYSVLHLFISFACPAWLMSLQSIKELVKLALHIHVNQLFSTCWVSNGNF